MRKIQIILMFFIGFSLFSPLVQSQELDLMQVMRLHRRAIGGIDAITAFVTAELELSRSAGNGRKTGRWYFGEENQFREIFSGGSGKDSLAYDGTFVYLVNDITGNSRSFHAAEGNAEDKFYYNLARAGSLLFPLMNVEKQGASLTLVNQSEKEVSLEATYPDDNIRLFTLNAKMQLIRDETRVSSEGIEINIFRKYTSFKDFDGAILPQNISVVTKGYYLDQGERIEINESSDYSLLKAKGNVDFEQDFFAPGLPERVSAGEEKDTRAGNFRFVGKLPAGQKPLLIRAADINNDGKIDLITANKNKINILYGDEKREFVERHTLSLQEGVISDLQIAELNGDKLPEIIVAIKNGDNSGVWLFPGSNGQFAEAEKKLENLNPGILLTGDFNQDNFRDLLVFDEKAEKLLLFSGDGDGRFAFLKSINCPLAIGLKLYDLNKDGIDDIVFLGQQELKVYYSNSGGWRETLVSDELNRTSCLAVEDYDGDGKTDILVGSKDEFSDTAKNRLIIFSSPEDTFVKSTQELTSGSIISEAILFDINNDGVRDLLVCNSGDHRIDLYINEENVLSEAGNLPAGWSPTAMIATELFAGKTIEIVILNSCSGDIFIWSGN